MKRTSRYDKQVLKFSITAIRLKNAIIKYARSTFSEMHTFCGTSFFTRLICVLCFKLNSPKTLRVYFNFSG